MPDGAGRQAPAHPRLPRRRLPPGEGHRGDGQPGVGQPDDDIGHGHAARRLREGKEMTVQGNYMGMNLTIDDLDQENLPYFRYCAEHNFHLQKCDDCSLLRYPPTTGCPWCSSP